MSDRLVPLGEIVATHGISGWLKLNPYNFDSPFLSAPGQVIIEKGGARSVFDLESSRLHRRQILFKLRGVDSIEAAQPWVGSTLAVREEALEAPAPGEYYHYRVIGFEVFDMAGTRIGIVTRIWSTPGAELYVVAGVDKEHLIPAVKGIIEEVDFETDRITVNPPPGLLDL
ncbi:MAG: 16S rRNA processing protein RimM [Deltaproteobacteria bacterium]|nr:16S rRNA processing protein RimM [Deltaproteobacteria bacterium]